MDLVNNLKISFVAPLLVMSSACYANSLIEVTEAPFPSHMEYPMTDASFKIDRENPQLGRAWVELDFRESDPASEEPALVTVRKNVDGLHYSADAKQIVYQSPSGKSVVCANVETSTFLFFTSSALHPTGDCIISIKKLEVSASNPITKADDGYKVRNYPVAKVELAIQE